MFHLLRSLDNSVLTQVIRVHDPNHYIFFFIDYIKIHPFFFFFSFMLADVRFHYLLLIFSMYLETEFRKDYCKIVISLVVWYESNRIEDISILFRFFRGKWETCLSKLMLAYMVHVCFQVFPLSHLCCSKRLDCKHFYKFLHEPPRRA